MPTCPGCHQRIPHRRLTIHEQVCSQLRSGEDISLACRRLETRLNEFERQVEKRLGAIEETLDVSKEQSDSSKQAQTYSIHPRRRESR